MFSIKQPNQIVIGKGSAHNFQYPNNSLLITSKGAKSRGWIKKGFLVILFFVITKIYSMDQLDNELHL